MLYICARSHTWGFTQERTQRNQRVVVCGNGYCHQRCSFLPGIILLHLYLYIFCFASCLDEKNNHLMHRKTSQEKEPSFISFLGKLVKHVLLTTHSPPADMALINGSSRMSCKCFSHCPASGSDSDHPSLTPQLLVQSQPIFLHR